MKSKILLLSLLSTNAIASIDLTTQLRDVYGQTNTAVYINCVSTIDIQNMTNANRTYVIGTRLCPQNKDCVNNKGQVTLLPGKKYSNTYTTVSTPTYSRASTKDITCTNYVEGDEGRSEIKHAHAYIS